MVNEKRFEDCFGDLEYCEKQNMKKIIKAMEKIIEGELAYSEFQSERRYR